MARPLISGIPKLTAKLDDLSRESRRIVSQSVLEGATIIAQEAVRSVRAGAVSGRGHVPSKPGEPPNADTHFLDRSILARQTGELEAQVQVTADYAAYLEFGTSKMAARPFLQPAVNKTRGEVIATFFGAIAKARGIRSGGSR